MHCIDFRCRPPFGNLAKDWIFNLDDKPGNPGLRAKYSKMRMPLPESVLHTSMSQFFVECEKAGICHTVVPLRKLPGQNNCDLVELLKKWPGLFTGFAGIQPLHDGIAESLEEIGQFVINGPCAGIYMEPGLDPEPWEIDKPCFFPIYELCQANDIPVCFLFGGVFHKKIPPSYSFYNPERVERVAAAFPDMRIALSHACWPFAAHACALALNWENVWLSPDGFMIDHPGGADYIVAANYRLRDKIIFGSLYPGMPMDYSVRKYKELIRADSWEQIFYGNVRNFLGARYVAKLDEARPGNMDKLSLPEEERRQSCVEEAYV